MTGPAGIEYTESAVVYAKELSTLIEISVSSIDVPILLMSSLQEIVQANSGRMVITNLTSYWFIIYERFPIQRHKIRCMHRYSSPDLDKVKTECRHF